MVFQDPYSSLNPRMTVSDIIGEPLDVHHLYKTKQERHDRILELMDHVGLNSEHAARYAHEFSTILPRYMTAILSLMWRTTSRSWAMKR